jgi:hypothetical protein
MGLKQLKQLIRAVYIKKVHFSPLCSSIQPKRLSGMLNILSNNNSREQTNGSELQTKLWGNDQEGQEGLRTYSGKFGAGIDGVTRRSKPWGHVKRVDPCRINPWSNLTDSGSLTKYPAEKLGKRLLDTVAVLLDGTFRVNWPRSLERKTNKFCMKLLKSWRQSSIRGWFCSSGILLTSSLAVLSTSCSWNCHLCR